jgi:hypothetical protein
MEQGDLEVSKPSIFSVSEPGLSEAEGCLRGECWGSATLYTFVPVDAQGGFRTNVRLTDTSTLSIAASIDSSCQARSPGLVKLTVTEKPPFSESEKLAK